MTPRVSAAAAALAALALLLPAPAVAQQTLNVTLGYFTLRGEDARVERDVLSEHRTYLEFDVADFNGPALGAEWLVPLGGFLEAGAGVGFSRRTVPSVYSRLVEADGSEIEQDLRLRLVPVAFTFRVLPLGQASPVQPYAGAGLGVFNWRYSESGDFVDATTSAIFREQYVASGSETGPVVLGGIRFAGDAAAVGFEVRYQSAEAALGGNFTSLDPDLRIDLGGWTYLVTAGWRIR